MPRKSSGESPPAPNAGGGEHVQQEHESREWLRVTLSSIGDAVITTDANGNVTFLNPVAETLTGWTNKQATAGRGVSLPLVFRIVNETTRREVENPAIRALRDGLIVGLANHTILIARNGTERPIDDSAAPIRNKQGEIAGTVLVFRDITERRKGERIIQESLDYAQSVLNTMRHGFLVLDKDLRVVSANRNFYRQFAVQQPETQGRRVYELGNGQWNIPELRRLLGEILPANQSFEDYEVEHEFETIGWKCMALNARRVNELGSSSERILLGIEDVTARKNAEEALRDSEIRYRRLFQTAKDGILILDAQTGKIIDANGFMSGLTGLDYHSLIGKELYEIGMYKDIEENKQAFRQLQEKNYLRHEHLPMQNRRGERVEIEMIANVYQEDHHLVAQCNVRDISERVKMQKQIADQAEAIASESRRKDEFLAMLSHELRNPLAPIRSAVHLLRAQERGGAENVIQKQAHEIIERQVASLTKLISDLLEVSRVTSGRIRLNLQVVDVGQVIRHAVETAAPLFEQRRHKLALHLGDEPIWCSADPTRLEEVFINVLNNAAKYTPDGGRIEVWCEHPAGTNYAQVRVRDDGVGIEKELLPRVFDLFTQADRSLARSAGGLGIGLSLAHRLMELHGGTIEAISPPPQCKVGSEFVIRLAMAPPPAEVIPPEPAVKSQKRLGMRVLVVDDNIDLVMMLASSLRQKGHSVQSAYTGPNGLKIAQQWRPDVILLDIGLPGLDGYEVARRIRAAEELDLKNARLIALTGYGRDVDISLAREAGFDAHVVKPCDFNDLEKLMQIPTAVVPKEGV